MTEDKKVSTVFSKFPLISHFYNSSSYDSSERLAILPSEHDMMLPDINEKGLKEIGDMAGIANLSPAEFPLEAFPVEGRVCSMNKRLMVCLPCRRVKKFAAIVNVWFIVDTGSNANFLSRKTIEALICKDDLVPKGLLVAIQDSTREIECYISPLNGNFADANVLGMEALKKLDLSIIIN